MRCFWVVRIVTATSVPGVVLSPAARDSDECRSLEVTKVVVQKLAELRREHRLEGTDVRTVTTCATLPNSLETADAATVSQHMERVARGLSAAHLMGVEPCQLIVAAPRTDAGFAQRIGAFLVAAQPYHASTPILVATNVGGKCTPPGVSADRVFTVLQPVVARQAVPGQCTDGRARLYTGVQAEMQSMLRTLDAVVRQHVHGAGKAEGGFAGTDGTSVVSAAEKDTVASSNDRPPAAGAAAGATETLARRSTRTLRGGVYVPGQYRHAHTRGWGGRPGDTLHLAASSPYRRVRTGASAAAPAVAAVRVLSRM